MNLRTEYCLQVSSIKEGEHLFEYMIDDDFLKRIIFENDFKVADVEVQVILNKQQSFLELLFRYFGTVQTHCDRCSSMIPLQIWQEFNLLVKRVSVMPEDEVLEMDMNVAYMLYKDAFFDIEPYVIDYFKLSIPMVKQCSEDDFQKHTYCDQSVLEKITKSFS